MAILDDLRSKLAVEGFDPGKVRRWGRAWHEAQQRCLVLAAPAAPVVETGTGAPGIEGMQGPAWGSRCVAPTMGLLYQTCTTWRGSPCSAGPGLGRHREAGWRGDPGKARHGACHLRGSPLGAAVAVGWGVGDPLETPGFPRPGVLFLVPLPSAFPFSHLVRCSGGGEVRRRTGRPARNIRQPRCRAPDRRQDQRRRLGGSVSVGALARARVDDAIQSTAGASLGDAPGFPGKAGEMERRKCARRPRSSDRHLERMETNAARLHPARSCPGRALHKPEPRAG